MELKPISRPTRVFVSELVPDVSIVMPCLNEVQSLPHCIANARDALVLIEQKYGLSGEIVIADNGSTDGSQALAESLGARVVVVPAKGYGAALIGGFGAAYGRYLVMGDADGSYDFTDGVAMIGRLMDGADVCMGSRFAGGIAPGAMPWKNRYIGNPVLTGILNLLFKSGIDDAHCGLRALTKDAFLALGLRGSGMEFASEMVIKASLKRLRIDEVPAKLRPDLRQRPPHLRPWRDGWRHLRYLLMLSPTWLFGLPAALAMITGLAILCASVLYSSGVLGGTRPFGAGWAIIAGFLLTCGHLSAIIALATHLHGVRAGYRTLRPVLWRYGHWLTLEAALISGGILILGSFLVIAGIGIYWTSHGFLALPSTLPLVCAVVMGAIGMQTIVGGFLMAIMAGHEANLVPRLSGQPPAPLPSSGLAGHLISYTGVSGVCLVLHNLWMIVTDAFGMMLPLAVLSSFVVVGVVSYTLHSRISFRKEMSLKGFLLYSLTTSANIPFQMAIIWFWSEPVGLSMYWAAPVSSVCMIFVNYVLSHLAIGRPSHVRGR